MDTHQQIDERSLLLAQAVALKIDRQESHLEKVRAWAEQHRNPATEEWLKILDAPWVEIREALLDPGPEGQRRRQSSPFVGVLTPQERWQVYREFTETVARTCSAPNSNMS